jgi:uncharacterized protein YcbX
LLLSQIHLYPIKSAGGIALREAELDSRGLRYDRRWMLVDGEGRLLTQRRLPRMALISPTLSVDSLLVHAPGMPTLRLALDPEEKGRVEVSIFGAATWGAPVGEAADRWFGEFLGTGCRLLHMPDDVVRPVDPRYAESKDRVGFADGYPFLLLSEASLADLNARMHEPVPMDRFRPNLVVTGCEAYAEDGWRRVRVAEVSFRVVKPCVRCSVTTVDQASGARGKEPLRTLARYRRDMLGRVLFGQNLIHDGIGTVRVGDAVVVVRTA